MGELNFISHVQMKIDAIVDVIDKLKSQYDWMKSQEDAVSLPLSLKRKLTTFKLNSSILFFSYTTKRKNCLI